MKMLSREKCIAYDITDPTPWEKCSDEDEVEEEAHEILDGRRCPKCRKRMMSNEHIVCGSFPSDHEHKHDIFLHSDCLTDEMQEILEKLAGYSFCEDLGEEME